jgi:Domain of unknown function (DUF4352)
VGELVYRGTLASGGTFTVDGRGIRIADPAGNQLANFGREVISGINRDGQIVTLERHNDTIVTLTASSISDAIGLERHVRDTIIQPAVAPPPPPSAFDAFDERIAPEPPVEPRPSPPQAPRPPIISRHDPTTDEGFATPSSYELPEPVPTTPRPAAPVPPETRAAQEAREPIAPLPPQMPPAATPPYAVPTPTPPVASAGAEKKGGRRLWLWGCLGCGGLIILSAVCVAALLSTDTVNVDRLTGNDKTPTPYILIATEADATDTEEAVNSIDSTPTEPAESVEPTATDSSAGGGGAQPTQAPSGEVMAAGETGSFDGMEVTFVSSRTDGTGLIDPAAGNEYLILKFELTNTTADAIVVSTLLQFELRDESDTDFPVALFADVETSLDTEVPAGETAEGEVAFEVPQGSGPYIVSYSDFFSENPLQWHVN